MNSMEWPHYSEGRLFSLRQRGFTLIEVMVSLLVVGVFTGMLMICMSRIIDFVGSALSQMIRYQEVRTFYRLLRADCKQAILRHDKSGFHFFKDGKGVFLLRRVSQGQEQILPERDGTISAIRYEFSLETGVVARTLWGGKDTLTALMAGGSYSDTLLQKAAHSTKTLMRNVNYFQMCLIDSVAQQQESWERGRVVSIKFSFASQAARGKKSEVFFIKIPLLKSDF